MDERKEREQPASSKPEQELKPESAPKVAKVEDLDVSAEQATKVSGGRMQPPPEPD